MHSDMLTHEQFLELTVGLGLGFIFCMFFSIVFLGCLRLLC